MNQKHLSHLNLMMFFVLLKLIFRFMHLLTDLTEITLITIIDSEKTLPDNGESPLAPPHPMDPIHVSNRYTGMQFRVFIYTGMQLGLIIVKGDPIHVLNIYTRMRSVFFRLKFRYISAPTIRLKNFSPISRFKIKPCYGGKKSHQTLRVMDGLVVADGATLTLNITNSSAVVTFFGGINLEGNATVVLQGSGHLEFAHMTLTATDLEKIIIDGNSTATVSPQHDDDGNGATTPTHPYDVYSFMATPGIDASGDGAITLSWQNPDNNFDGVLIRGSTDDYPDSIDNAADYTVYIGNGDTTTDTGLEIGRFYYYTAFGYMTGAGPPEYTYTPMGVKAMAAPTFVPENLVAYYPFNKGSNSKHYIEDGSGYAHHGLFLTEEAISTTDMTYADNTTTSGAYAFNGTDHQLDIDNPMQHDVFPGMETGDFTMSVWLKIPTIIIDNTDSRFTTNGFWNNTNASDYAGFYGSNYHETSQDGSSTATWTPDIQNGGNYRIYMRWPVGANRPDETPVRIHYYNDSGYADDDITVNQTVNGGKWNLLGSGSYQLSPGENNYVSITASDSGNTAADAVMFVHERNEYTDWYDGEGIINGKTGDDQNDFGLTITNGKPMFGVDSSSPTTLKATQSIADNNWYNITATRQKSGKIRLYVNGVLDVSANNVLIDNELNAPSLLTIGSRLYSNNHFFQGHMDEVRIYNQALDASDDISDIQKLWSGPLGLQAYYSFDDATTALSTMIAKDYSGNGNDATLDTSLISQPSTTTDRYGVSNKAFYYDGYDDYIQHNIDIRPSKSPELTITFWVKHDANFHTNNYIYGNRKDVGQNSYWGRNLLARELTNGNHYYYTNPSCTGDVRERIGLTQIQYDEWEHIAIVYKVVGFQNRIFLYRNGVDDTNGIITETYCNDAYRYFRTGLDANGLFNDFEGSIDDVKIFYKACTDDEIRILYLE